MMDIDETAKVKSRLPLLETLQQGYNTRDLMSGRNQLYVHSEALQDSSVTCYSYDPPSEDRTAWSKRETISAHEFRRRREEARKDKVEQK